MILFEEKLDLKSNEALSYAINKSIQSIIAGNFEIDLRVSYITSSAISLNLTKHKYLIIRNDWADTPDEAIDYFLMSARIEETPADIKTKDNPKSKNSLTHYPNFSSFCLGARAKLKEISIYEAQETGDSEKVRFDSALLFIREDKVKFLIKNSPSIVGQLNIIYDNKQINEELSDLNLRLRID